MIPTSRFTADCRVRVRSTYELFTPESIEHGDASERGFLLDGSVPVTLGDGSEDVSYLVDGDDLLALLELHAEPSVHPLTEGFDPFTTWFSSDTETVDLRSDTKRRTSVHLDRSNSDVAVALWRAAVSERFCA